MDNKMLHHSKAAVFIYKTELIPIPKYNKYKHTHTHIHIKPSGGRADV